MHGARGHGFTRLHPRGVWRRRPKYIKNIHKIEVCVVDWPSLRKLSFHERNLVVGHSVTSVLRTISASKHKKSLLFSVFLAPFWIVFPFVKQQKFWSFLDTKINWHKIWKCTIPSKTPENFVIFRHVFIVSSVTVLILVAADERTDGRTDRKVRFRAPEYRRLRRNNGIQRLFQKVFTCSWWK